MTIAYAILFCIGLIAGVRIMLYGVERPRTVGDKAPRSFSGSPAAVASFCGVAGLVGYAATRFGATPVTATVIAAIGGTIAAIVATRAIGRWWTIVPEHDVDDERYVLQGSIGRIVGDILAAGSGQVAIRNGNAEQIMPAREIDDRAVPAGTEVVIERIENGVAFVEAWATVEKRL